MRCYSGSDATAFALVVLVRLVSTCVACSYLTSSKGLNRPWSFANKKVNNNKRDLDCSKKANTENLCKGTTADDSNLIECIDTCDAVAVSSVVYDAVKEAVWHFMCL